MHFGRVIAGLLASGLLMLAAGATLFSLPANAQSGYGQSAYERQANLQPFQYTSHGARAVPSRVLHLYVDRDFSQREQDNLVSALRQWNHVLNGMLRMEARLLPEDPSGAELARIKRNGGWLILRVDSRHAVAHRGEGLNALAVTVGGSNGGAVYVISDRMGGRDFAGVMMHEFGHVLGAGHGHQGLMGPVYSAAASRCIDQASASLVAQAQRLPLREMNWCEGPSYDRGRPVANHGHSHTGAAISR